MATSVQAEVPDMTEVAHSLTAADRCDRCCAQALVITRHGKSDLLWCAHHYAEHEQTLEPLKVLDRRTTIEKSDAPKA